MICTMLFSFNLARKEFYSCFLHSFFIAYSSNYRTGLEDATNTTPHGNQRLHVQWWKAPGDGRSSVRNM
jgi:hypothetical protein